METIGPELFSQGPDGKYKSSIGTLFPHHELLVTHPPLHALQRCEFSDWFVDHCAAKAQPIPHERKVSWESGESVDLILALGGTVLIRPEIERLDLAFEADEQLQRLWKVPKHKIRFVGTQDPRVRQALRERGELWRTNPVIEGPDRLTAPLDKLQVALEVLPIYYYNPHTGTRFLTLSDFKGLAQHPIQLLTRQLTEIAEHCIKCNRHGHPEIAFYGVDPLRFGAPNFVELRFDANDPESLLRDHARLVKRFTEATPPLLHGNDLNSRIERLELLSVLSAPTGHSHPHHASAPGVGFAESPMSVRWLPGGCFQEGEFVFESLFPSEATPPTDPDLVPLWDPLARGFIANFIREYGNIEHLNLGKVEIPVTARGQISGRRGVYIAEIKVRDDHHLRTLLLRVQRWGIIERLEELGNGRNGYKKELVQAILETEEYVDYTLDRRLGCLQFGMRLPARVNMRRVSEVYLGHRKEFYGMRFPVIYYERDYLQGTPSNQIPDRKLADTRYAEQLARILGTAAAPNMLVGRVIESHTPGVPGRVLFDDGDEIIIEGPDARPSYHALVDHSAAFTDWQSPDLLVFAKGYADPVNRRVDKVPDPATFAATYLTCLLNEIRRIQSDYITRRTAFDGLFKHLPYSEEGSFACRWDKVLCRLQACDVNQLGEAIRKHITVLT